MGIDSVIKIFFWKKAFFALFLKIFFRTGFGGDFLPGPFI